LSIDISQVTGLEADSFTVSYDPDVFKLDSLTGGEIGQTSIPPSIRGIIGNKQTPYIITGDQPIADGLVSGCR
jgi:hypothetical protein